jgi:hypothetical protein
MTLTISLIAAAVILTVWNVILTLVLSDVQDDLKRYKSYYDTHLYAYRSTQKESHPEFANIEERLKELERSYSIKSRSIEVLVQCITHLEAITGVKDRRTSKRSIRKGGRRKSDRRKR